MRVPTFVQTLFEYCNNPTAQQIKKKNCKFYTKSWPFCRRWLGQCQFCTNLYVLLFFFTTFIHWRQFFVFCFLFLSICKSNIPLTSVTMNLKLEKGKLIVILSCFRYSFNFLQTKPVLLKNNFWDSTGK